MKHALVTGAPGFLGSAITRALLERGVAVRGLALPGESLDNLEGLELELIRGNVLDHEAMLEAMTGIDTVFHTAALYRDYMPDPCPMYEVNLRGSFHVLEAARRKTVTKVVYTSSMSAIGRPPAGAVSDENAQFNGWEVDWAYPRTKWLSMLIAEDFAKWGLDVSIVCPGILLGPGDITPTPSGKLIVSIARGEAPGYLAGGANYVDVRDVAQAHLLAADKGRAGERYLATGFNLSNLELLELVGRVLGQDERYRKIPLPLARALLHFQEWRAERRGERPAVSARMVEYGVWPSYYSNRKAVQELGATFRQLDETVSDAVEYFRRRGMI